MQTHITAHSNDTPFTPEWDRRFLRLAREIASWSKDPSTQCGAVIVRPDRTICSTGYNGFPRRMNDHPDLYANRPVKYSRTVHAEMNAILCSRDSHLHGFTVYVWPMPPCDRCMAHMAQSLIGRIVCPAPDEERAERWKDAFEASRLMCEETGIQLDLIDATGLD